MDETVKIFLSIKKTSEHIKEWMMYMRSICPNKMDMQMKHYKRGRNVPYNEKVFLEEMDKEIRQEGFSKIAIGEKKTMANSTKCLMENQPGGVVKISSLIEYKIFAEHEQDICELMDRIMEKSGIVGCILSGEDHFWQNATELSYYRCRGRSTKNLPLKRHEIYEGEKQVNTEKLPGYEEMIDGIWFGAVWKMWFNTPYYEFIPREAIENFTDCESNAAISDTCRCITLYKDMLDYENPQNRARQWKFKKATHFKKTVRRLRKTGIFPQDPNVLMEDGRFEHGGMKRFTVFLNDAGKEVYRSRATQMKVMEFNKAGELVWETIKPINIEE